MPEVVQGIDPSLFWSIVFGLCSVIGTLSLYIVRLHKEKQRLNNEVARILSGQVEEYRRLLGEANEKRR